MGNQFDLQALNPLAAGKRFLDHLISHLPKPAQNGQHQNAKGPETLRQKPLSAVDPITLPNQVEQTPYALPMAPPHPAFLGGKVSKEELGRATWTFLHTLAGQFPEHPTKQQQKDVKTLMDLMTRIYPCSDCAKHFLPLIRDHPPVTSSGEELQLWMCQTHNRVNRALNKPIFNCNMVGARWGALDCDDANACSLSIGKPPQ